jgi:TonB family protein
VDARVTIPRTTSTRRPIVVRYLLAGALWAACTPASAQPAGPLFNGIDLTGWRIEHTTAEVREGAVHVSSGNGWVRTERPLSDFVLSVAIRTTNEKTSAGLFVRAWPTFDASSTPNNGYRLRLIDGRTRRAGIDEWLEFEIECVGRTVRVRSGGAIVFTADAIENPQGYLALWSSDGTAQFRGLEVRQLPLPRLESSATAVVALPGSGVVVPRPVHREHPRYTPEAMRARIQGTVVLSAVVKPDGTVGDVVVRRSLDPSLGLDDAATATARKWQFEPGTRDGSPVSVRILMEFEFNLR